MSADFDYCIIGGGAVGLAIARQLSPLGSVLLVERHALFGSETSSRNSEVIHAGLYYADNSLKQRLCLRGKELLYAFCEQFDVPHQRLGKLIVAQQAGDPKLAELEHKAQRLGIPLQRWNQQQLQQQEPAVRAAEALFSPSTGIIDSHQYMQTLAQQAEQQGALLMCQTEFLTANRQAENWHITLNTSDGLYDVKASTLINSAGLQAQSVARHCGQSEQQIPALYPCRGHYFSYSGSSPFHHLIYPLPEANLAGLGIHATLDLGGQLRFGPDTQYLIPNGVLSYEVDPQLKGKFASAIQRYFPELDPEKLHADYAGIRPKLHPAHQKAADFVIQHDTKTAILHLFGIESPGLTASLAIAESVQKAVN
ncbi:NAD(P)/FAD-dependent oxidoreductase [Bacterioplanoides sp.]|uniref:NAD(P)/FAD-dependent oxidoreductase n=1 Tax=Bacterioplanoides sp. TaxID=2066072 RepID=UPI003B00DC86